MRKYLLLVLFLVPFVVYYHNVATEIAESEALIPPPGKPALSVTVRAVTIAKSDSTEFNIYAWCDYMPSPEPNQKPPQLAVSLGWAQEDRKIIKLVANDESRQLRYEASFVNEISKGKAQAVLDEKLCASKELEIEIDYRDTDSSEIIVVRQTVPVNRTD